MNGIKDGITHTQDAYRPEHDAEYRFVLSSHDESVVKIEAYMSGNNLLVDSAKVENEKAIRSYARLDESLGHHLFRFTKVVDGLAPTGGDDGSGATASVRGFPRLTSLDQEIGFNTEPQLLDEEILPFFLVRDPGLAPYRQVVKSPYYRLTRSLRWEKLNDRLLDGQTKRRSTETTTVGMTQLDAASVASTFSWSVEVSAEAGYTGPAFSASMSVRSKIAGEVARTRQHSTEHRTDRTFVEEVAYPKLGKEYRIVKWRVADVYDLLRAGDEHHPIYEWSVTREGEEATDLFVSEGLRGQARLDPTNPRRQL